MHFMLTAFKRVFPRIFAYLKGQLLLLHPRSSLVKNGLLRTYAAGYPCRPNGLPIPYMNYSFIAFLEQRLKSDMRLFEYGSGYSTLFYARYVHHVVTVESDREWYEKINKEKPDNVVLLWMTFEKDGDYCRAVRQSDELFDVIVIDGPDRVRCAKHAVGSLSPKGIIIIVDSEREGYREGLDYLSDQGFKRIDIDGIKPNSLPMTRTSIFYRDKNCFDI